MFLQVRLAALVLGLLGLLEVFVWWRLEPPALEPEEPPSQEFSAARAQATLGRWLGPELPHPAASPEQTAVRERLVAELSALQLAPELQGGIACDQKFGVCAEVVNVIAIVPGNSERLGLALIAHYDSVPAGPGAGDDGQGTASLLEIARALRVEPADENIALVFTDGEELGLLGARLFVREHPLLPKLHTVINVEARGSRGPSLMFQTTPGSAWLVELYARAARHPVTSSLFPAVYRLLPNDTDLTVFAEHGLQGLNFAFIGGVENYHTANDDMSRLDFRSVAQQGESVLGLARQIAAHGGEAAGAEAIFFDVLALGVVRLDMPWFWCLVLLSNAVLACCTFRALRQHADYRRALPRALGTVLLALGMPCVGAWLLTLLLGWLGGLPFFFVALPAPLLASFVLCALASLTWAQGRARSAVSSLALWDATWLVGMLFGWLVLMLAAGGSYVFWVPVFAAALVRPFLAVGSFGCPDREEAGAEGAPKRLPRAVIGMAPVILVSLLIWLPPSTLLYDVIGFAAPPALALAFTLALQPVSFVIGPLLTKARGALVLGALALLSGLAQVLPVAYSSSVPQRLSLALSVDADGQAEWLADTAFGPLPASLASAAEWQGPSSEAHPLPGFGQQRVQRAMANPELRSELEPVLRAVAPNRFELELRLPAPAWAVTLHLRGPLTLDSAIFRGQNVQPRAEGAWNAITLIPGSERHVVLSLSFASAVLPEMEISELTRGLPPQAAGLVAARGDAAVTSQLGDLTLKRVRLKTRVE